MNNSTQLIQKIQLVRNLIRHSKLQAAITLAAAMFLNPSRVFAPPIPVTDFPSWEVASEFNDTLNASGVWSYRAKATVGAISAPLLNVPYTFGAADLLGWTVSGGYPLIAHNVHPTPYLVNIAFPLRIPAHALYLHPGPRGQYAVVRFTAPIAGSYKVSGQFYALDNNSAGTTTDVWILINNNFATPWFAGNLSYSTNVKFASFTDCTEFPLEKGGTIEFEVGFGNNGYSFDTTGLNAVIERVR